MLSQALPADVIADNRKDYRPVLFIETYPLQQTSKGKEQKREIGEVKLVQKSATVITHEGFKKVSNLHKDVTPSSFDVEAPLGEFTKEKSSLASK